VHQETIFPSPYLWIVAWNRGMTSWSNWKENETSCCGIYGDATPSESLAGMKLTAEQVWNKPWCMPNEGWEHGGRKWRLIDVMTFEWNEDLQEC
jgi:hypothetical protein